jgi:PAS domain S-box-containing protein
MIGPGSTDILVLALGCAGVVGAVVATLVWRHRPRAGATHLATVFVGNVLWAVGQGAVLAGRGPTGVRVGTVVTLLGISLTALAWFYFALQYTGYVERVDLRVRAVVALLGVAFTAIAVANPAGLVYDVGTRVTWGPLHWAFFGYTALTGVVGGVLLLGKTVRSRNIYRKRTFLILVGGMSVLAGYALSMLEMSPAPSLTLSPLVFLCYGVVTLGVLLSDRVLQLIPVDRVLGLFSSRFRNIGPIARDLVIEKMGSGVVVLDGNNRIVDLNPLARELLGTEDRRIVGRRLGAVVARTVFENEPAFLDDPDQTGTFDGIWVTAPGGERRCYDVIVTDLAEHQDDVSGRVAIVHDVTDQQQRKRELKRRTQQLERQNEHLDEFAAVVSHDLRNPLQVLRGALDGARETDDPEHVDRGFEAVERMEALIEDILVLAREGKTVEEPIPVDVEALARDAWATVDTSRGTLSVTVGDLTVPADEDRLRQVFENLYRNALEHSPAGAPVTIRVGALGDDRGCFVADDGPGIPADQRETVFEHGFSTAAGGTGFGLSIVEDIVEAHGWAITAAESDSGGARFEIRLEPAPNAIERSATDD